jgi:hypothetical protein
MARSGWGSTFRASGITKATAEEFRVAMTQKKA